MRKTITRSIVTSTITGFKLTVKDGVPTVENLDPIVLNGVAKEHTAVRALKKEYGDGVTLGKIETVSNTYEISVDDFIKYAKVVSESSESSSESSESVSE